MLLLWCLGVLLCTAGKFITATGFAENETRLHGDNGWYVPHLNGSFEWMDKREAESRLEAGENIEKFCLSTTPVKFYLYTESNPNKGKEITPTAESINAANFNASHPTRYIIHGWIQSYLTSVNKQLRKAWLDSGAYNVIVVDWARARFEYVTAVLAIPTVGSKVANMIDFLANNYGMPLQTTHVIGHSLGAHVAGFAGKHVKTGQIHAIIGLDPALPLFSYDKPHKRLSATDAFYVETIQTNGDSLGFLQPIGKASFYPNGGKTQPGCPLDIVGACAHKRAVIYYAESITADNFSSIKCATYNDAVEKNCGTTFSTVRMGAAQNAYMAAGNYYVPVNKKSPFGVLS